MAMKRKTGRDIPELPLRRLSPKIPLLSFWVRVKYWKEAHLVRVDNTHPK